MKERIQKYKDDLRKSPIVAQTNTKPTKPSNTNFTVTRKFSKTYENNQKPKIHKASMDTMIRSKDSKNIKEKDLKAAKETENIPEEEEKKKYDFGQYDIKEGDDANKRKDKKMGKALLKFRRKYSKIIKEEQDRRRGEEDHGHRLCERGTGRKAAHGGGVRKLALSCIKGRRYQGDEQKFEDRRTEGNCDNCRSALSFRGGVSNIRISWC